MTTKFEITSPAGDFLERAYLLKPQTAFNLSSLAVFEENIDAHDAFDFADFRRLAKLGYVIGIEDRTWEISGRQVDVVIFQLTPLGLDKAQQLLGQRLQISRTERLHGANWAMWGGIAAMIAAIASVAGAIFAFRALQ